GAVAGLSPPLPRQPPLASVVDQYSEQTVRDAAAHDYGLTQGRALASLGVNLNFAPVVDLNRNLANPHDHYTRIRERAIAADPLVVADVARQYCRGCGRPACAARSSIFPGSAPC